MEIPIPGLHGAYRRRDLITATSRRWVQSAVGGRVLLPLWTGIVVESDRWLDPWTRGAAALLATGEESVLVGSTAAYLHGCRALEVARTHVRIRYGREFRSRPGLTVQHGGQFVDDIVHLDGLRALPLDRVVAELLCDLDEPDALAVTDETLRMAGAEHDRFRVAVRGRIGRRQDPRGTVRAAFLLDLASPRADSPPESWLRLKIIDEGFPMPEVNWPVHDLDGTPRFRVDLAWPQLRIAVEYDGYEAHAGRVDEDAARQQELERRGWIVVRVRKEDFGDMSRVHTELRAGFARRGYTW